jgi:hypothetical protein
MFLLKNLALAQILNVSMNKNIFTVIFFISKLIMIILIFTKFSYSNEEKYNAIKFDKNIKWICISGNCSNGFGVATYSDPQGRSIKYSGNWKDEKRHGKGEQERNHYRAYGVVGFNQKAYGEWENDKVIGSVKIVYSNGLVLHQNFSTDEKKIGERVITPDFEYIGEPIDLKFKDRIDRYYAYLLKNCKGQGFNKNGNSITNWEDVDDVWYFFSTHTPKHEIIHYFGRINSEKENDFYGEVKFVKDKDGVIGVVAHFEKDLNIRLFDKKVLSRNINSDIFIDYFCK